MRGDLPDSVFNESNRKQIIVPLRAAGRVHGAMIFGASGMLDHSHLATAQQLADLVASHLELLRKAVMRAPPTVPRLSS